MTMASDDTKTKSNPAQKNEISPKKGNETSPKNKSASRADSFKAAGDKTADPSSGYSRGEGQKPVSKAYKDNWNAIFAKKKK